MDVNNDPMMPRRSKTALLIERAYPHRLPSVHKLYLSAIECQCPTPNGRELIAQPEPFFHL